MSLVGQAETPLPDGRRVISAVRGIEDGARGVLLLEPGRLRLDATPDQDMFRLTVRSLDESVPVTSSAGERPRTVLTSTGIEALDLPLVGSAALTLTCGRATYDVRLATVRDPGRGRTLFTVQATVTERLRAVPS